VNGKVADFFGQAYFGNFAALPYSYKEQKNSRVQQEAGIVIRNAGKYKSKFRKEFFLSARFFFFTSYVSTCPTSCLTRIHIR